MLTGKAREYIILTITFLYILLFAYTATDKFLNFGYFTDAINAQPLNNAFTPVLIWLIPLSEILAVILLAINKTRLWGLYSSTVLMLAFTVYVALITAHYFNDVPCACAGIFKFTTWPQHLFINAFFLLIGIVGILLQLKVISKHNSFLAMNQKIA